MHARPAWRGLLKDRRFTVVGILSIALGIGATTAVFGVVDTVLLRPFPFAEADRIVAISTSNPAKATITTVSPRDLEDWSRESRTIAAFGALRDWHFVMRATDGVVREGSAIATPDLFAVFDVRPEVGRLLTAADNQPGQDHVVMLSYAFWRRQFNGDRSVVGRTVDLDHEPYAIVGVLPASFSLPSFDRFDIWAPVSVDPDQGKGRWLRNRRVYARLAPGAAMLQARAELETIARQLAAQYPDTNAGWSVRVLPLTDAELGDVRPALLVMLAAVGLLLVIACANLGGLLLARCADRRGELAIRAALGAARGDLVGMLVIESLTLTAVGTVAGILLSQWLLDLFVAFGPQLPRAETLRIDWRIVGFTVVCAAATGIGAAIVPALRASRVDLLDALRGAGRDNSRADRSARTRFVAIELAVALVLLVGAGLLGRSFARLVSVETGFRMHNVLMVEIYPGMERYPKAAQIVDVYQRLRRELGTIPGVLDVGAVSSGPLFGGREAIDLRPAGGDGTLSSARYFNVLPGYFQAIGIPVAAGRDFTDRDGSGSTPVTIVNQTLARRFWGTRSPIGEHLVVARSNEPAEVVGVVADAVKDLPPGPPEPEVYWPYTQQPRWAAFFVVHTSVPPADTVAAVRDRVRRIDPEIVMGQPRSIEERMATRVREPRFNALLLAMFAIVAVALAVVGVYGLTSYAAEQRVHEIGVRLSLGARPADIARLIVGQAGRSTLAGMAGGVVGALLLSRVLRKLLFGIAPNDPVTLVGAAALLALLALAAAWIPARRAARLDPLAALRTE